MINQQFKAIGRKYQVLPIFGICSRELGGSNLQFTAYGWQFTLSVAVTPLVGRATITITIPWHILLSLFTSNKISKLRQSIFCWKISKTCNWILSIKQVFCHVALTALHKFSLGEREAVVFSTKNWNCREDHLESATPPFHDDQVMVELYQGSNPVYLTVLPFKSEDCSKGQITSLNSVREFCDLKIK